MIWKWNMSNGAAENGVDRQVSNIAIVQQFLQSFSCRGSIPINFPQAADQDHHQGGGRGDGGGRGGGRGGSSYVPPHQRSYNPLIIFSIFNIDSYRSTRECHIDQNIWTKSMNAYLRVFHQFRSRFSCASQAGVEGVVVASMVVSLSGTSSVAST